MDRYQMSPTSSFEAEMGRYRRAARHPFCNSEGATISESPCDVIKEPSSGALIRYVLAGLGLRFDHGAVKPGPHVGTLKSP